MTFSKPSIHSVHPVRGSLVLGLLVLLALLAFSEPVLATTARYTAQRKPRVTVMEFENTNTQAQQARYGESVEAMLVTFLKRKSQFIVVERQKLGPVLDEWENNQLGMTNLNPQESRSQEILEKIDGIILGSVTLLAGVPPEPASTESTEGASGQESRTARPAATGGHRIEIDVKLLSRADGRILAAVQRSGPVVCLRSIVERLGVALEREFLRPYYGQLTFKLSAPENVHLYLTPVLMNDALDEEKPPVERGTTVHIGTGKDTVEPWTTDPTTYTVEDVLSGWYSIRLERPGYEGTGTINSRWEVRQTRQGSRVFEARTSKPLQSFPQETRRFLVWIDPLDVEQVDGDRLGFTFRKKQGSLDLLVKRQYLDRDYGRTKTMRVLLIGKEGIELNQKRRAAEFTEDRMCDFFEEGLANPVDYGRTYVSPGQSFDFQTFEGGELVIEDYQGEPVPVGEYEMVIWEPHYRLHTGPVSVRDRDQDKIVRTSLARHTVPIVMSTTGPKPDHQGVLRGQVTGQNFSLALDFESERRREGLPVDRYSIRTDIPGFGAWRHTLDLLPEVEDPPVYDPDSSRTPPILHTWEAPDLTEIRFKTRLTLAGRIDALGTLPHRKLGDWYEDETLNRILDRLLKRKELKRAESELSRGLLDSWTPARILQGLLGIEVPDADQEARSTPSSPTVGSAKSSADRKLLDRLDQEEPWLGTLSEDEEGEALVQLPTDPRALRELFAQRLQDIDLLVLDGWDLQRLHALHEVRSMLMKYVESGGALVAFVTEPGHYGSMLGAPLAVDEKRKRTRKLRLKPGASNVFELPGDKQKVRNRRPLPRFDLGTSGADWRILAYGHRPGQPRILERGHRDEGGYVLVWGDHPEALTARKAKWARQIDKVRRQVTDRAIDWARYLMYREYDDLNQAKSEAKERLTVARGR